MKTAMIVAFCLLTCLGWDIGETAAQQMSARYAVTGGSTVIILTDPAVSNFVTAHDRLFISLGIQREFFRQSSPVGSAEPHQPIVFEAQQFRIEEAHLNQAIQRLGELIRQAEKEEKR